MSIGLTFKCQSINLYFQVGVIARLSKCLKSGNSFRVLLVLLESVDDWLLAKSNSKTFGGTLIQISVL